MTFENSNASSEILLFNVNYCRCIAFDLICAGMGFGTDERVFPNPTNALRGLQNIVNWQSVEEATIIAPHLFGPQVTGKHLA